MDVDAALQSQIRNIETTYGKPLDYWFAAIDASGLTKHSEVVAMLKADHGRFNPLFTHRVRITAVTDLDDELRGWLATAYALAG